MVTASISSTELTGALVSEEQLRRVALSHNLTQQQFDQFARMLGRQPTLTEIGIFGVMASEHCSYASSKMYLKTFPTTGKRVLVPAGKENAGLIDIGGGLAVAFKVESHNHPSAVEPHAGAATGVGGILRDIFTMGARPIALFDSLRFGRLEGNSRTKFLFEGVVKGIADYGNCLAPDELVVVRNTGKVKSVAIGSYIDGLFGNSTGETLRAPGHIDVLSFDPKTRQPRWSPVSRLWRKKGGKTLRIDATMGRTWRLTPGHPSFVLEGGRLVTKPARAIRPGDLLPVLTRLPEEAGLLTIDLLQLFETSPANIYVRLKKPFRASRAQLQATLRVIEASACSRWKYRHHLRMPLRIYLALERTFGFDRRNLEVFLPSGKANYIGCHVTLDEDFARLIGYYLAEGCVSRNGTTYKIIWTFGHNVADRYYVADLRRILDRLGWRYSVERRVSTTAITVSSWFLGVLLKDIWHCGESAQTKSVPDPLFRAPRRVRVELLKGLFRGDGSVSIRHSGSRVKITLGTVSRCLANQTTLVLQALGILPLCYEHRTKPSVIRGRQLKGRLLYSVELNGHEPVSEMRDWFAPVINRKIQRALKAYQFQDLRYSFPRHGVSGPIGWVEVKRVVSERRNTPVYDFEVEGTHTFVTTGGLITHNCVGVPTVGGEIAFDETYRENPLVNVMCIGLVRTKAIAKGAARGVGNPVIYVGSSTGRDGLGGASFASRELSADVDADRPAVQIGDPFTEKCLLEATLEALATDDVVGIQDMGAAGLTCSSCEMPARGHTGIEIDVAKVPRREAGMTPYEVMLSESQERMLLVARRGRENRVKKIFEKWGLNAVEIGRVTATGRLRVTDGGAIVADIPVRALTNEAPVYHRPVRRPRYLSRVQRLSLRAIPQLPDAADVLRRLLASPTIASKALVYEQYDHMVQTNTAVLPGRGDAAVLRIKATGALLASTTDGNGRYGYLDPYEGGKAAVAEAARNLVCVGATPLAVTNCLNFGDPQDPEIMWQFKEAVRGIGDACRAFQTPVTGGNVSFYNERQSGAAIDPTPVIGMIGLIVGHGTWDMGHGRSRSHGPRPMPHGPITASFKDAGDAVLLLGETREELGGSEYLAAIHGLKAGAPPRIDLAKERALQRVMLEAASHDWLKSAHDCSDGGLAVAIAESCLMDDARLMGALVHVSRVTCHVSPRVDAQLFGESSGRIVVSCLGGYAELVLELAKRHGVPAAVIGAVGGTRLVINPWIDAPLEELSDAWRTGLQKALETA